MKVICKNPRTLYKVSVNSGRFYEFIDGVCEVENKEDLEFFKSHKDYEVEKKGGK